MSEVGESTLWSAVPCLAEPLLLSCVSCVSGMAPSSVPCIVICKLLFLFLPCRLCYSQTQRLRAVYWSARMKGQPIKSTGWTFTSRVCFSIQSRKTGSWHTVKTKRWAHLLCLTQRCIPTGEKATGYPSGTIISLVISFSLSLLCSSLNLVHENISGRLSQLCKYMKKHTKESSDIEWNLVEKQHIAWMPC